MPNSLLESDDNDAMANTMAMFIRFIAPLSSQRQTTATVTPAQRFNRSMPTFDQKSQKGHAAEPDRDTFRHQIRMRADREQYPGRGVLRSARHYPDAACCQRIDEMSAEGDEREGDRNQGAHSGLQRIAPSLAPDARKRAAEPGNFRTP